MDTQDDAVGTKKADDVYKVPAAAQAEAEKVLADPSSSALRQSEALATLGRAAYYDNRMGDAVAFLSKALPLADDPVLRADIALILAPAMSKEGNSSDALLLLEFDDGVLSAEQEGKVHNQRGIIHIELGRLPDALKSFEAAREVHRTAGDQASEGRVLVNMAAAASEIGELEKAGHWYEEAWTLAEATGQQFAAAIIEGNLGYLASRKGDFGAALAWYKRGRDSFSELGDVDLLVAVLETDHATTLLDLGLNADAFDAAEYARRSSANGSNRMLEVQALLLLGEAQLRLRQYRGAEESLQDALDAAFELDLKPWVLRSEYLLNRLRAETARSSAGLVPEAVLELAEGLLNAAWYREALRSIVLGARTAIDLDDWVGAKRLLEWSSTMDLDRVDSIDREYADALRAFVAGNAPDVASALERGFDEIARQQQLLGSAELQVRLGHRSRELRSLALRGPLDAGDPEATLTVRELGRMRQAQLRVSVPVQVLRSKLRDSRVGLQEARLAGASTADLLDRISGLEADLVAQYPGRPAGDPDAGLALLANVAEYTVMIAFLEHRDVLWAVRVDGDFQLIELGAVQAVDAAARTQRTALRRMAAAGSSMELSSRAEAANQRLDDLLLSPLQLDGDRPIHVVADAPLAGLAWAGLPSFARRRHALSPNVTSLAAHAEPLVIRDVGLLEGGGLAHGAAELDELATMWRHVQPTVISQATVADATRVLASCDFVHIAAHGTFRADNPFFSSLEFVDGALTVLDLEELERLPAVIVLASCDTGAAVTVGAELIGTTETLLALGVHAVVAPTVAIDDASSKRFVIDLHRELLAGLSIDAALLTARRLATARGTSADLSAAHSFHVHGGQVVTRPLSISRI